jgi:hypothetical protein
MIKKIKHALGIESVKIKISLPQMIERDTEIIPITVEYTSQSDALIKAINIKCVEKYERGRKENKLINEYIVGNIDFTEDIKISSNESIVKTYLLKINIVNSEMDKIGDSNFLFKGLIKFAKFVKSVKSEYRIEAEARVSGTKLHPLDRVVFEFK